MRDPASSRNLATVVYFMSVQDFRIFTSISLPRILPLTAAAPASAEGGTHRFGGVEYNVKIGHGWTAAGAVLLSASFLGGE